MDEDYHQSKSRSKASSSSSFSSSSSSNLREKEKERERTLGHLRQTENWVKHVLIGQLVESGARVCEFNCGSGSDLGKWQRARIEEYVGFDQNVEDLQQAENSLQQRSNPFPATFRQLNPCRETLPVPDKLFDVVACFRGFGLSFESPTTARDFLENVSCCLKPGGYFFGILPDSSALWYRAQKTSGQPRIKGAFHHVRFDDDHFKYFGSRYSISVSNYLQTQEYLVHFPSLLGLAKNVGLKMIEISNFTEFYEDNRRTSGDTLKSLGVVDKKSRLSPQQLDLMGLYTCYIFEKLPPTS